MTETMSAVFGGLVFGFIAYKTKSVYVIHILFARLLVGYFD
jgi:hypothetical protein